jgi:hypothetical protein
MKNIPLYILTSINIFITFFTWQNTGSIRWKTDEIMERQYYEKAQIERIEHNTCDMFLK